MDDNDLKMDDSSSDKIKYKDKVAELLTSKFSDKQDYKLHTTNKTEVNL